MAVPHYEMDKLFDESGLKRIKDSYLCNGEKSPQERFAKVCNIFSSDEEHAKRLYHYASNHYISFSTPILSYNDKKNLPISCYLIDVSDTIDSIINSLPEANTLSVGGGGVSIKLDIRPADEKSAGIIPHTKIYDSCMIGFKQQNRRGSYAIYLDINHPEVFQFIDIRKPTGDYNMRALNVHHSLCISDKFMEIIERCTNNPDENDDFELINIHTNEVVQIVSAKSLWERIINTRMETGEPFMCFIDTCNRYMNKFQKEKGLKIRQSNLCTEVIVPTDINRSSLCCLASLNLEYYDEWKNNYQMIKDLMELLDNVLLMFIKKATEMNNRNLDRVLVSAIKEKNIGVGALGFHSFLQKNNISFESEIARKLNIDIFKKINEYVEKANLELGALRGSPDDIIGSGKRFTYCMAIAPTASTSIIMGNTSPSVEPYRANIYRQDTVSGAIFNKNKFLEKIFLDSGFGPKLREKIWKTIIANNGSVQHLPDNILSKHNKNVFKTFTEIDQEIIIQLAADRQQYIDQGQSINITLAPNVDVEKVHRIHLNAWKQGLKTLYYCRSEKIKLADNLASIDERFISCEACSS